MKSKKQKQLEALERRRLDLGRHHGAVARWQKEHREAVLPDLKKQVHELVLTCQQQLERCLKDIHNLERKLGQRGGNAIDAALHLYRDQQAVGEERG